MPCLPGNPCHKTPLTDGCGVPPCSVEVVSTDKVYYTGPNLPCIGLDTCTTLTSSVSLINDKLCSDNLVLGFFSALSSNAPICSEDKTNLCEPDCENCIPDNTMTVECKNSLDILCEMILECTTTTTSTTTAAPICVCYELINNTFGAVMDISWVSCDGSSQGFVARLDIGSVVKTCAQKDSFIISSTGDYDLTGGSLLCTSTLDCTPCYCYSVESSTIRGISIGWVDYLGNPFYTSGDSIPGGTYLIGCAQEDSVTVESLDPYTISGGTVSCKSNDDCTTTTTTTALPECSIYQVYSTVGNGGGFFQYYPCGSSNIVLECMNEGGFMEVCADNTCGIIPVTNIDFFEITGDCTNRPTTTSSTTTIDCSNSGGTCAVYVPTTTTSSTTAAPGTSPCGAIELPLSVSCTTYTMGTTLGGTIPALVPSCNCGDITPAIWYKIIVPSTGAIDIDTQAGTMIDGVMAAYLIDAPCGVGKVSEIACVDDVIGTMPYMSLSGLDAGATVYISVSSCYIDEPGTFGICATIGGELLPAG